eukprot:4395571-Alexandrium_andersonii.AAC.1
MSASLVGSEMCIRDRVCVLGPCLRLATGPVEAAPAAASDRAAPPFAKVAVSYTHLTLPTICSV